VREGAQGRVDALGLGRVEGHGVDHEQPDPGEHEPAGEVPGGAEPLEARTGLATRLAQLQILEEAPAL
jgi:hypothetical protein